jgi:hypothetical protein
VKFAFIDEEKATWPVVAMCDVLAVSRSGFYAWKARPVSARTLEDVELVVDIKPSKPSTSLSRRARVLASSRPTSARAARAIST